MRTEGRDKKRTGVMKECWKGRLMERSHLEDESENLRKDRN